MGKFVVYKVIYNGDKLPPYYIGSTSIDKINNGYRGSIRSKKWKKIFKNEIKDNPHLFDILILSKHETREEALIEENKIQKEYNVVESNYFFNESYANINGYFGRDVSKENNPMYGRVNEVIVVDIKTNKKYRVKKEDFDNNSNLAGHTIGMLSVIDKKTKEVIRIPKDEFSKNRDRYKHHNEGIKHSEITKKKLSKIRSGMITAKDWEGNFHRVYKDDIRFDKGIFGNTTSKRWIIEDTEGNVYKTFSFIKFFKDRNLRCPRKEHINKNGIVHFPKKSNKLSSTEGWKIKCLN